MLLLSSLKRASVVAVAALSLIQVSTASANPLEGIPSGAYELDLTHASVVWKVNHLGFSTYVGRFTDFDAEIQLDSENFEKSSVNVDIKVDSLDTAYPFPEKEDFNKKLSEEWFKSADHPTISFKASSVSALDGSNFTVAGDLSLMGQTHPVTLNATINGAAEKHPFKKVAIIGFSATTTIDRTQWGLSNYAPNIGAEVAIEIEGEFLHKQ